MNHGGDTQTDCQITADSIIVGIDVHKYTHTAVALNCFGKKIANLTFPSDQPDICSQWLSRLRQKDHLIIGLEDISGNGRSLTKALHIQGFHLRYVPAILTDRDRRHSVHKDKSDLLDATRVGKVILTKSEETLPADTIVSNQQEGIRELDFLLKERDHVVTEQTGLKNILHALLHEQYGNGYQQSFADIFSKRALLWYTHDLESDTPDTALGGSIRRHIKRLQMVQEQITEIGTAMKKTQQKLAQIQYLAANLSGCGELTASAIVVEIGSIGRFARADKLAKYAGIAPISDSSGKTVRYRTNPFGNRKLNRAIHRVALSQIGRRGDSQATTYYQRKVAEGKSKLWALRCLKRQIIDRVFRILLGYETHGKTVSKPTIVLSSC